MFKVEYEEVNNLKPWMVRGDTDWFYTLMCAVSVGIITYGVIGAIMRKNWPIAVIISVYYLGFFYLIPKFIKVRKTIISKFGTDNWKRELIFDDDEIINTEYGTKGVYTDRRRYDEIVSVREEKNSVLLKMKTAPHISFQKDKFTIGDWQQCQQFITERMTG